MKTSVSDSAELQFHIERIQIKQPLRPIVLVEILLYILAFLGALCMLLPVLPAPEALAGLQGLLAECYIAAGVAFALVVLAMLIVTAITARIKKMDKVSFIEEGGGDIGKVGPGVLPPGYGDGGPGASGQVAVPSGGRSAGGGGDHRD